MKVNHAPARKKRRKKVMKRAKGFWGERSTKYRRALETLRRAGAFAYAHRRLKKREFRSLWIVRLNAAVREKGMLYKNFIHLWNTGDEWGDTLGTLFAVAEELHNRGEGPPASWDYSPGAGVSSRNDDPEMSDQDKYDQALNQQQGMDDGGDYDEYMDLKHVDTPTLEKFGEFLIDLRDKLEAEGKDY